MFEIGEATNTAMQRLVTLLVSDIRVSFDWVVLRFAKEEVWTASHNLLYLRPPTYLPT